MDWSLALKFEGMGGAIKIKTNGFSEKQDLWEEELYQSKKITPEWFM